MTLECYCNEKVFIKKNFFHSKVSFAVCIDKRNCYSERLLLFYSQKKRGREG